AGSGEQPADGERLTAVGTDLDRNLIGGAADAAGADLDLRHDVVERLAEDSERILLRLRLDHAHGAVDDRLRDPLLAVMHHRVHELGDDLVLVLRVRDDLALFGTMASRHVFLPWLLSVPSWPGLSGHPLPCSSPAFAV